MPQLPHINGPAPVLVEREERVAATCVTVCVSLSLSCWRDASAACPLARRARSLARCGTGLSFGWQPIFNSREGGERRETLEPCHRSRPGIVPSQRRPAASASRGRGAAGPGRCTILAWEPARSLSAPRVSRARPRTLLGAARRASANFVKPVANSDVFAQGLISSLCALYGALSRWKLCSYGCYDH